MKLYILLSIFISFILCTECPNGCSGHGICSSNSECICNRQVGVGLNQGDFEEFSYTGADCSQRLCPTGGSYAATPGNSWWQIVSNTYTAYFMPKGCFGVQTENPEEKSSTFTPPVGSKYVGNKYIYINGEVPELSTYESGGIVNCYGDEEAKNLVGSYRIYNSSSNDGFTVLVGEKIYEDTTKVNEYWNYTSSCEKADDAKEYYCKVVRAYKDISLLAALPINIEPSTTKSDAPRKWTLTQKDEDSGDKINFAHLYYAYFGTVKDKPINVMCPNRVKEMEMHETKITISSDGSEYTVTINKVPSTYGNCFILYSPVNGNLDLATSELKHFIGTESKFGDKVDDSAFIWKKAEDEGFDLTKTLLRIKANSTDTLEKRDSSAGEIRNSIAGGSSALMYRIDLYVNETGKDERTETNTLNPIKNQIVHLKSHEFVDGDFLKLDVLDKVAEDYMCNKLNDKNETSSTVSECTNSVIGLQLFQEGPHSAVECSGVGECNRETGKCECPVGFQGSACQRTSCPNNCSGKGKCLPYLNSDSIYGNEVLYHCVCDGGFRGSDCSKFECPSREDPKKATNMKVDDEFRDCSGRGICDYESGICSCFDGFSGEACDKISSIY